MPEHRKRITSFGEILWDVYPNEKKFGGAPFNFIYHIWKILGKANFISSVGNDYLGKEMIERLSSLGFNTNNLLVDSEHPTGTVRVVLDENKNPRFTPSINCCFDFITPSEETLKIISQESDMIYFGSFSARSETTRETLLSLLNFPDIKYFCDLNLRHNFYTKDFVEKALLASNVIKLNDDELNKVRVMFDLPGNDLEACSLLLDKFGVELVGLTLGENGAHLFRKNEHDYYKSEPAEIVDTLGAGDAFASILCLGYLNNLPLTEINILANSFALKVCKANGALPSDEVYPKYISAFAS